MGFKDWPVERQTCGCCRRRRSCTKVGLYWLCVACVETLRHMPSVRMGPHRRAAR